MTSLWFTAGLVLFMIAFFKVRPHIADMPEPLKWMLLIGMALAIIPFWPAGVFTWGVLSLKD